jgi:O-antigen ligase
VERFKSLSYNKLFIIIFLSSGIFLNGFVDKSIFLVISILSFAYLWLYNKKLSIDFNYLCMFFLSAIVSTFLSVDFENSFHWLYINFFCVIFFFYFYGLSNDEKNDILLFIRQLSYLFSVFFFFIVLYKFFLGKPLYFIGKNPNYLSLFFGISLIFSISDYLKKKDIVSVIVFILSLSGLLIINSRASFFSLFVSVFILLKNKIGIKKTSIIYIILASAYLMFFFPLLRYNLKLYDLRAFERIDIWSTAFKAFMSRPIFGWGGGDFSIAFEYFKFPYFDGLSYYNHSTFHAHSEILNVLCENGIAGFIFYLLFIKEVISHVKNVDMKIVFIFFTLFSFVDIVLYLPFFRFGYFIIAALMIEKRYDLIVSIRRLVFAIICFIAMEIDIIFVVHNNHKTPVAAYSALLSSKNYVKNAAIVEYSLYSNPHNAVLYFELGRFYFNTGDMRSAILYLKRAYDLEPLFRNALLMLAQSELYEKNNDMAEYYFKRINPNLSLVPDNFYSSYIAGFNSVAYDSVSKILRGK